MAIQLPIGSRFDELEARRTGEEAQRYFSEAGRKAGDDFSRNLNRNINVDTSKARRQAAELERSYDKAADAAGRLRTEEAKLKDLQDRGSATRSQLIKQSESVERARRAETRAVREAVDAYREFDLVASDISATAASSTSSVTQLGDSFLALSRAAGPVALAGAAEGLINLGGVAVNAAGAIWLLPAAIGGVASAFGTLKLATLGFGDALSSISDPEKFSEALKSLSPNAQQAALSIQALMPELTGLKNATQDALFAGVGDQLKQLTDQYLPTIQSLTTGVASAFNQMFSNVAQQLMAPDTQAAVQAFTQNITDAFQALTPAVAPLTHAFADIAAVGSSFLPDLARAASEAAQSFSDFISRARESGELRQWIQDALDVLKQIPPLLESVLPLLKALGPAGAESLAHLTFGINTLTAGMRLLSGDTELYGKIMVGVANMGISAFNALATAINVATGEINKALNAYNSIPGLPDVGTIPQIAPLPKLPSLTPNSTTAPGASPSSTGSPFAFPDSGSWWPGAQKPGTWGGPPATSTGGGGGSRLPDAPVLPFQYSPIDGLAPQVADAQGRLDEARHEQAEKEARLNQLKQSNTANANDIQKAENDVIEAKRRTQQAERGVAEAQQSMWKQMQSQAKSFADGMGQIGAALDNDLGISKGLPGIAENLTKFLANLAFAPALGALNAVVQASGGPQATGSGLVGVLAANGAFGPQYTVAGQLAQGSSSASYSRGMPAAAAALPGESARDFAHRVMMPYWESQGLTVGDHQADQFGEHQNGALDIMVPNLAEGQKVLQQVLADPNVYGAIFNNQTYGYGHGLTPQDYTAGHTGNPTQDHQDHVHAWYKPGGKDNITPLGPMTSGPVPVNVVNGAEVGAPPGGWSADWLSTAQKESGGNWSIDTGNGYQGGLQFSPSSWQAAGGTQYAPSANLATPFQQALTAENLLRLQGPGAWPNTFTPGSAGPAPSAGWGQPGLPTGLPGGGGMMPGAGMPQGLGFGMPGPGVGGAAGLGAGAGGMAPPSNPQGGQAGLSGAPMDALMGAASGLDMMMPGAGAAAKIGIQLLNRTAEFGGQVAGIAAGGVGEFLQVGDNPRGSLGASWIGKLAGGLAGARPALPNMAGQKPPASPQGQQGQQAGVVNNNNLTVTNNRAEKDIDEDAIVKQSRNMWSPPGRQ